MFGLNKKQNTSSVSDILESNLLSGKDYLDKFSSTENAVLVDVRTEEEFNTGHIEKAVNISISNPDFVHKIKELDKSKTYFIYCHSGGRSSIASQLMKSLEINNIYDLDGGLISNSDTINLIR